MKNTALLPLFLLTQTFIFGQSRSEIQKSFTFSNNTDVEEIKLTLSSDTKDIWFHFSGKAMAGQLNVAIFDPNEKREGGFQLEAYQKEVSGSKKDKPVEKYPHSYSITGNSKTTALGSMNKTVTRPIPGNWKVVISSKKLEGELRIKILQTSEK